MSDTKRLTEQQLDAAQRWVNEVQRAYEEGGYAAGDGPSAPLEEMVALLAEVRALRADRDRLLAELAACYRLSGADPDGNSDAALAPYAVPEVTRLRQEADEADAAVVRLEARVAELEGHDPLNVFAGKP